MALHILGAGPSGLCAAINLCRAGERVRVHERQQWAGMRFLRKIRRTARLSRLFIFFLK